MSLIFELLFEALMGFTQMFVTALWQTEDPAIIAKRNICLTVYGVAATVFIFGFCALLLHAISIILFVFCLGLAITLFVIAGQLADQVEKLILQQKTPDPKIEDSE